jgi:hypothetical protein
MHTEINGEIVKNISTLQRVLDFDGIFNSITNDIEEPVTDSGILVMKIIEAAIESSAQQKVVLLKLYFYFVG